MNKTMSAAEVIGQLRNGMTIGIGGWGPRRKPMALVREILRSDLRDLTVVAYGGADVGHAVRGRQGAQAGVRVRVTGLHSARAVFPSGAPARRARDHGDRRGHVSAGPARSRDARALPADEDRAWHRRAAPQPADQDHRLALRRRPRAGRDAGTRARRRADPRRPRRRARGLPDQGPGSLHGRRDGARGGQDLRQLRRAGRYRASSPRPRRRATCSGSAPRPPAWCTSPAARTRAAAARCMASTCRTSRNTRHLPRQENGWSDYVQKYVGDSEAYYQQQVGGVEAIRKLPLPTY
jgi:hypothetical protein